LLRSKFRLTNDPDLVPKAKNDADPQHWSRSLGIILQKGSEMWRSAPLPTNSVGDVPDNRILDYCLFLQQRRQSILLTNDRNLAIKARAEQVSNEYRFYLIFFRTGSGTFQWLEQHFFNKLTFCCWFSP
jgi:hypothetical protein